MVNTDSAPPPPCSYFTFYKNERAKVITFQVNITTPQSNHAHLRSSYARYVGIVLLETIRTTVVTPVARPHQHSLKSVSLFQGYSGSVRQGHDITNLPVRINLEQTQQLTINNTSSPLNTVTRHTQER